jgi:hypothetical protein
VVNENSYEVKNVVMSVSPEEVNLTEAARK